MKTLVCAKHEHGPAQNGDGGCYARFANHGICPGLQIAAWLNELSDDDAPYPGLKTITCGQVRANWLRGSNHITTKNPHVAALLERKCWLRAELRSINRQLREAA